MGVYGIVVLSFFQAIKQSPYHNKNLKSGLEITAGQRTMSGQNRALSEQIRG